MAKTKKPFISRKRRKEMDAARQRRESIMVQERERIDSSSALPTVRPTERQPIQLPTSATVGEFSQLLNQSVVRVIGQLMKNGMMAAINDRIDFDTMAIIADEFGFIAEHAGLQDEAASAASVQVASESPEGKEPRPPVVTVMGHVDHGKTSLLDYIRKSNVAGKEVGGITQHIGAYQTTITVEDKDRVITFLDTPGHEAFTALRSHGAQVTDIVILVVAADDGVMPQTIEALNHARSAHVPIIVAITKVDLPSANVERVKQQLAEQSVIPEEWGGETVVVGVSSVSGQGIAELLEYIVITADIKQLKADPAADAQGVVIESHQETGLGPVATVLIQNGTLKVGDVIVIGQTYGKVRSLINDRGERIREAGPSVPAQISGIEAIPNFGEGFAVVKNEREARELVNRIPISESRYGISDISQAIAEGRTNTLKIVLKADAQGSLEALRAAINKLEQPGVKPMLIHTGIGDVSLTDIQLAAASQAVVFGFNVAILPAIKKAAENQGVTVTNFDIIYDLLNQIELTLRGLIQVKTVRVEKGRLKVLKVFRSSKESQIVGGTITQGIALAPAIMTINRSGELVGEGRITSLQKGPEVVSELEAGQECGVSAQSSAKILEGDVLVFFTEEEVVDTEPAIASGSN